MKPAHRKVGVRVPATSANLGPGFDCVGCALTVYDEFELTINLPYQKKKVHIDIDGYGADTLSRGKDNLVYRIVNDFFARHKLRYKNMKLTISNNIPLARGLGSSAAARIGALIAASRICGLKDNESEVLDIAARGEGHADNVVPALYGGLCITRRDNNSILWWRETMADDLCAVVGIPDFEIKTPFARRLIPLTYTRKTAVYTTSGAAFFVSAVTARTSVQRNRVIQAAMKDKFHQPYRRKLISGMEKVFESAGRAGALGAALSGSGPSIIAIVQKHGRKDMVGRAMVRTFKQNGINSTYRILEFNTRGARIL